MKVLPAVVFVFGMALLAQGGIAGNEDNGSLGSARFPSSMLVAGNAVQPGGRSLGMTPPPGQSQPLTPSDPAPWLEGPKTALEKWLLLEVQRLSNAVTQLQAQQNSLQASHVNHQHPYIDTNLVFGQLFTVAGFRAYLENNQHNFDQYQFFVYQPNTISTIGSTHNKVTDKPK
ncbi:hypothetical protein YTPLAS18_07610 [Nitrospira sp.]|nr:hypothetical protein YTPLAS18_07610 [Nitrospira sp.]